jgi:uncharacterized membrane protein YgaE (UPF0421/DUF939 family)
MITLIIVTISVILLISLYIIFNLLKKVEKLEDIAEDSTKFILKLSDIIKESDELIKAVDEKGTFKSDDEVGEFFEYLKQIQQNLNNFKIPDINGKKTE